MAQNNPQHIAQARGALRERVALSVSQTAARWAHLEIFNDLRSLFFFLFFWRIMSSFEQRLQGEEFFVQLYSAAFTSRSAWDGALAENGSERHSST